MNREIKFRAWDKREKILLPVGKIDFNKGFESAFLNDHGLNTECDMKDLELMQSTGLKDKNGKDCYEGDLINGRYGKDTVYWNESICGFTPFAYGSNAPSSEEFEVIGNIYENPELTNPLNLISV